MGCEISHGVSPRVALVVVLVLAGQCLAQPPEARQVTAPADGTLAVSVGRSTIVRAPWAVKRVSITDPKVADVQMLTPSEALVSGKLVGTTDLLMWNKDEAVQHIQLEVGIDRTALRADLARLLPGSQLEVTQSGDVVVISGTLRHAEDAQQLHKYMEATTLKYVDLAVLPGVQQVQIRVLIAEASRTAVRAMGMNAVITGNSAFGGLTVGSDSGGPLNPVSIGVPGGSTPAHGLPFAFNSPVSVTPAATLFAGFPGKDLEIFVQALAENQYVRVLAEPNLIALSGQEANFLAGGEFPIPVVQAGGGGGTSISVEYKEFGVRLQFRPTVLGDGNIRLHVLPEVSELSNGPGSVQIQGFTIPAILTRRAETTLELHSGQTFGIAGLISQSDSARNSHIPVLGSLPILGPLFRSVRYESGDTELVVLVTASLVEPASQSALPLVPGGLHRRPSDWEFYLEGRIEGKSAGQLSATDSQQLKRLGLDRLKGPGAWVNYDSTAAVSEASLTPPAKDSSRASGVKTPATQP